jgi:anti-anti-sigma regulatory factor
MGSSINGRAAPFYSEGSVRTAPPPAAATGPEDSLFASSGVGSWLCRVPATTSEHEVQIRAFEQSLTTPFGAVTNFEGRAAVVSLRGSVDDVAAFDLAAILDAAIDREPTSMILEVAGLVLVGATGLVVVANAERRLAAMGVALEIQSPSAPVNHLRGLLQEAPLQRA